jgi:hypothetical protein
VTPHNEVLVHELHGDLSGLRVWGEALQQRRPRDGVKITSQQEPPYAQAVFFGIWKGQFVMDILRCPWGSAPDSCYSFVRLDAEEYDRRREGSHKGAVKVV